MTHKFDVGPAVNLVDLERAEEMELCPEMSEQELCPLTSGLFGSRRWMDFENAEPVVPGGALCPVSSDVCLCSRES